MSINIMEKLNNIKSLIETLNNSRQLEILRIIVKNKENYTENMNGTFVNLTKLNNKTVEEINKYLKYISDQDLTIEKIEKQKTSFKETFFSNNSNDYLNNEIKDNKDKDKNISSGANVC